MDLSVINFDLVRLVEIGLKRSGISSAHDENRI